MSRALTTTEAPAAPRAWEGVVLALLGGAAWWGSHPYAPFGEAAGTVRLFELIPAHGFASQGAAVLLLAFATWRVGVHYRSRLAAWRRARGRALRGDVVAAACVFATLGFFPRGRAGRTLVLDGLAAFPNDLITWIGAGGLLAGAAILVLRLAPRLVDRAIDVWEALLVLPPRRFILFVGGVALLSSAAVALGQFNGLPVATDGVNYRFQANIYAHGHLTLPPPPVPERFTYVSTIVEPRWRSIVTPGWPVLLAAGLAVGLPWLMNPLCHAGSVMLLCGIGARWWGDRAGRVAALLGCASPFLLLPAGSHMAHTSTLFGLLLFLYCWQRMADASDARWGWAAGLALGWAATVRPLDAAAMAVPWGVWTLWRCGRGQLSVGALAALGAGVALPLLGLGWYNAVLNGSPTTFGYTVYYGDAVKLGFGEAPDLPFTRDPHTPARGIMNTNNQLNALNKVLLGWPIPALALVVPALRAAGRTAHDRACALGAGLVMLAYFFIIHADFMYGARYYHAAAGLLLLLVARGAVAGARAAGPRLTAAGVLGCLAFAGLGFFPPVLRFYRPDAPVFQGVQTRLHEALAEARLTRAVVLVEAGTSLGYGSAVWRNGAGAAGAVVFAKDDGKGTPGLRAAFPDRPFYRFAPGPGPARLVRLPD